MTSLKTLTTNIIKIKILTNFISSLTMMNLRLLNFL